MLDAVSRTLRRYEMLCPGDRVVCAVSGGADSMALLWAMYLLKERLGITLEAAHFNHGLRGGESDRDEAHVREFCGRFDIPLHVGRSQILLADKGLEAAARDARYSFLEGLGGKLATAHTADDNAETVLMHLVRGTGLKGLGGITPVRGRIIRPMLDVTRLQVLDFLQEYHVRYVEDSSNATDEFLRNRLRHHVMPLLRQENPRIGSKLSTMAQRLRLDEQALSVEAELSGGLCLQDYRALTPALQNRLLAAFLKHCGVAEPDGRHIELLRALAESADPSATADLPAGVTVGRQYDRLVLLEQQEPPEAVTLPIPGAVRFGATQVRAVLTAEGSGVCPQGRVQVRSRQAGDSIRLSGGTKSLKKLFIDRKLPAHSRPFVAVVADEKGVLAVEGFGYNLDRLVCADGQVRLEFLKER